MGVFVRKTYLCPDIKKKEEEEEHEKKKKQQQHLIIACETLKCFESRARASYR